MSGQSFLSGALSNIGFILLTVVIVNFFWEINGGEPIAAILNEFRSSVRLLNDSHTSGIERLIPISGEFGSHGDWMIRLRSAKKEVNLMGYSLHVWTRGDRFQEEVERLVVNGVRFRVMIMDEENPHLHSIMNDSQITHISLDQLKDEILIVKKVFDSIDSKLISLPSGTVRGSLEFRTIRKGVALCQICRTDNEMTVINYMYSVIASHSPLILIRGSDSHLFSAYLREFDGLWELNPPTLE